MEVHIVKGRVSQDIPVVVLGYLNEENWVNAGGKEWKNFRSKMQSEGFRGNLAEGFTWGGGGLSAGRLIALGLDRREECRPDALRRAGGRLARLSQTHRFKEVFLEWPDRGLEGDDHENLRAFLQGVFLGNYRYDRFKTQKKDESPGRLEVLHLCVPSRLKTFAQSCILETKKYTEAVFLARDLVNGPPSRVTPRVLAEEARRMARANRYALSVFGKSHLHRMGMEALLGVNRGSAEEPFLIHLRYRPPGGAKRKVALVGKGITFDSGGLSLKPAGSMETMKMDMAGAAAVLGVFHRLAEFHPKVEVHGIIPTTENMPGAAAYKPGDVLRAYNGKTIEVLNTDAEGRLILADALSYAVEQKVDAVIDMATLTGAVIIALGTRITGAMTNARDLWRGLRQAMEEEGEAFWELPLPKDYEADIRSRIADVKNLGAGREAGSIAGGLFLKEFVGDTPWVHLDIAGTAYYEKDYPALPHTPFGATGVMVRSLLTYLRKKG